MQEINHKKLIAFILVMVCIGIILYETFLTEREWCYRDSLGRIKECSKNLTYLKEKYGLGELKIEYDKLIFRNNS